ITGFSLVFIALGAGLSLAGFALTGMRPLLFKIGGATVIAFGLVQLEVLRIPLLSRSFELRPATSATPGYGRSFVVGATYSLAWTPCIGPVLGAILTGVLVFGDLWQGMMLLGGYALGMAIPHLAAAIAFEKLNGFRQGLQRHTVAVERVSGTVMVVMGILIFTGTLIDIFRYFQAFNMVL
ncbi:cytochrome c biogenesis protein CcdA, partial [bacterium]|nr:cytochrome c biogenesis protein CcdA [bacterium]